jgi:threonine aldolase
MRSFASDNNAGVSPEIMNALNLTNKDHAVAYGDDPHTEKALLKFKEIFGKSTETFFVFNGTAANVLSLKALTQSFDAILCSETAHVYNDECGAPEALTGCKLIPLTTPDGKLTVDIIKAKVGGRGDQHHVQPRVITITQSTELGTVYTREEIKAISTFARKEGLFLHMDGARLANAAVHLNCSLKELTGDCGVDVLSFGGTKNGLMGAEAVVFFNSKQAENFKLYRKQFMQLSSKMRYVATQFEALFENDLWKKNALKSNEMAQKLLHGIETIPQIKVCYPVQANGLFVKMPREAILKLQEQFFFYVWNEERSEVRWMTSFDTRAEDINLFIEAIRKVLN